MKRVLLTGSREWPDREMVGATLDALWDELGPFLLVHGGARGADRMARIHQDLQGRPTEEWPADWNREGSWAGFNRNARMVEEGADLCVAFIYQGSRGATHCAGLAEEAGIPVRRYVIEETA